jgi:Immunoglobulin I-set domain
LVKLIPISEEEVAELTCDAVGDPTPKIRWFKNGNELEGTRRGAPPVVGAAPD